MSLPDPGGAICTACGPVGSPAYIACNGQVAIGLIPACAAPKGGVAPQQSGGSSVAATQPTSQTAASSDPWYCFIPGAPGCSGGATGINWGDIGIRAGLIVFGVILVLLVIAKMIESPEVVIEK